MVAVVQAQSGGPIPPSVSNIEVHWVIIHADFGTRFRQVTAFTEIAASIGSLKHGRDRIAKRQSNLRLFKNERR